MDGKLSPVRDDSVVSDWNFELSVLNPADAVTREFDFIEIRSNNFYWQGPRFLFSADKAGWSNQKNFVYEDGAFDCQVRSVRRLTISCMV